MQNYRLSRAGRRGRGHGHPLKPHGGRIRDGDHHASRTGRKVRRGEGSRPRRDGAPQKRNRPPAHGKAGAALGAVLQATGLHVPATDF